jgi:translation initiation factor 2B subunit (eIF-2B alpha/beta/delta family)
MLEWDPSINIVNCRWDLIPRDKVSLVVTNSGIHSIEDLPHLFNECFGV